MLLIISTAIFLLIFPGIYAYLRGYKFLKMEHNDEFALKYFKYQQNIGLVFWFCLILFFVFTPFLFKESTPLINFLNYTYGFGYIFIFFIAYALFVCGFSFIDQIVRENRVSMIKRMKFDISLLFLISWPYIFIALELFGVDEYYLFRAIIICILYFLFYLYTPDFWNFFFKTHLPDDTNLLSKFTDIINKAKLAPVNLYIFSTEGIKFANAFTVGQWGGKKSIFITDYAYKNLSQDDILSIYAHEIGHLQKHQLSRRSLALMIPMLIIPIVNICVGQNNVLLQWSLFIIALVAIKLAVPSQKFEKDADLFALNARGNAEVVIAGLEKIYHLGLVPRRFNPAEEKKFTHPSLVQRIKYIRKTAGTETPKLQEIKEFNSKGEMIKVSFSPESFNIYYQNGQVESRPYNEILAMFPAGLKNDCRLTVRYRDKNKFQKIYLNASYYDLSSVIEQVESDFADLPVVDPKQFKREYYLWSIVAVIWGLVFTIFVGPSLVLLGILGLAIKKKNLLLSYCVASAIITLGFFITPEQTHQANITFIIFFGLFAILSLYYYLKFLNFREVEEGKGQISFYLGLLMLVIQSVILTILIINLPPNTMLIYRKIFLNFAALSLGILLLHNLKEKRRAALVLINILLLLIFVIFRFISK